MTCNERDQYSIISLSPDDWEKYRDIRLEAVKNDPQAFADSYEESLAFSEELWRKRLQPYDISNQWNLFLVDKNEQIIGLIGAFGTHEDTVLIVGMYIAPQHRGKGLSSLLMEQIIKNISALKQIVTIELSVNKAQLAAIALYKSFGFEITGQEKSVFADGNEYEEYVMIKRIKQ